MMIDISWLMILGQVVVPPFSPETVGVMGRAKSTSSLPQHCNMPQLCSILILPSVPLLNAWLNRHFAVIYGFSTMFVVSWFSVPQCRLWRRWCHASIQNIRSNQHIACIAMHFAVFLVKFSSNKSAISSMVTVFFVHSMVRIWILPAWCNSRRVVYDKILKAFPDFC